MKDITMDLGITSKQLREELKANFAVNLVPYVTASPGVGKSAVAHQLAEDAGLEIIDLRLSQCTPEDLQGYPMRDGNKATFTPFSIFPLDGEELPEGKNGWLLLLDELSSAQKPVQAAAYKLILDRMVGSFKLHEKVWIMACGNLRSDNAIVFKMSTALQSRMTHYQMKVDLDSWTEWAMRKGIDFRIIAYVQFAPQKLMDFDPNHTDNTYPCPRTWEFLSRLIKDKVLTVKDHLARVSATIGKGAAVEFLSFCEVQRELPSWNVIVDKSRNKDLKVPTEASARYATICMISTRCETSEIEGVLPYVRKFPKDLQVIFCRGIVARFRNIDRDHKEFREYFSEMITVLQQ